VFREGRLRARRPVVEQVERYGHDFVLSECDLFRKDFSFRPRNFGNERSQGRSRLVEQTGFRKNVDLPDGEIKRNNERL
jgi:hypothetical protein